MTMSNGPTTANLGTPNMTPIVVGGPSASASAKGGAFELLLQLAKWGINLAGGVVQANKAKMLLRSWMLGSQRIDAPVRKKEFWYL